MAEAFICKRGHPARPHRPGVVSGTINKHYIPYRDQPTHSPNRCQTGPGHAGREAAGAPKQSLTNGDEDGEGGWGSREGSIGKARRTSNSSE